MPYIERRVFLGAGALAAPRLQAYFPTGSTDIDATLRSGIARRNIPAAAAMVADSKKTLYSGAFGKRDSAGPQLSTDVIFNVASMTKAITAVAALQLVEQGKLSLTEPAARHLPELANIDVLDGFDAAGKPKLRPAKTPVTLHHLLTHTCGFCYALWDEQANRYEAANPQNQNRKPGPLMFEPGTRWQYGQGIDWAGRLVEKISGTTLEEYFQAKILKPLGMVDTSYILPEAKFNRLVSRYRREANGALVEGERKLPERPRTFGGGGGLYSTVADYTKFMQMILNKGAGPDNTRILSPAMVDKMMTNQIGRLTAGKMKSFVGNVSSDVDIQPGHPQKWSLGFLINAEPYAGGRAAGSLAWAGLYNTFYWIDPKNRKCAVLMMQFLPFVDKEAIGLLNDFEQAVYRSL